MTVSQEKWLSESQLSAFSCERRDGRFWWSGWSLIAMHRYLNVIQRSANIAMETDSVVACYYSGKISQCHDWHVCASAVLFISLWIKKRLHLPNNHWFNASTPSPVTNPCVLALPNVNFSPRIMKWWFLFFYIAYELRPAVRFLILSAVSDSSVTFGTREFFFQHKMFDNSGERRRTERLRGLRCHSRTENKWEKTHRMTFRQLSAGMKAVQLYLLRRVCLWLQPLRSLYCDHIFVLSASAVKVAVSSVLLPKLLWFIVVVSKSTNAWSRRKVRRKGDGFSPLVNHRCVLGVTQNKPIIISQSL